jgi:hypothetical protein
MKTLATIVAANGILAASAVAALLCLVILPASAHVLQFTPTASIGSNYWPDPTPITITFTGSAALPFYHLGWNTYP